METLNKKLDKFYLKTLLSTVFFEDIPLIFKKLKNLPNGFEKVIKLIKKIKKEYFF